MVFTKIQMLLIVKITFCEKMQYMPTFCLIYSKLICQIRCPGILIGLFETLYLFQIISVLKMTTQTNEVLKLKVCR